jgi:hypothetical protein
MKIVLPRVNICCLNENDHHVIHAVGVVVVVVERRRHFLNN